jgi:hypothetical protein
VAAALRQPIRRELEGEGAYERGGNGQLERAKPRIGEGPGERHDGDQEDVPRDHGAEGALERPVGEPERKAAEDDLRLDERLEAVRVDPGRGPLLEPVADEPEPPARLQVVADGGLAVPRQAGGEEGRARLVELVADGRERRGGEEERDRGSPEAFVGAHSRDDAAREG